MNEPLPPLDPELARYLSGRGAPLTETIRFDGIAEARRAAERAAQAQRRRLEQRTDLTQTRFRVRSVGVLALRPARIDPSRPGAVILFLHGGGTYAGNEYTGISQVADWVVELGVTAISVDYRLAPEHPYPAGLDDAYEVLSWLHDEGAPQIGAEDDRVIVAGSSAGGNLALGLVTRWREAGGRVAGQLLMSPMLEPLPDRGSRRDPRVSPVWDAASDAAAWQAYLGGRSPDTAPYAVSARVSDLCGTCPTYLDVGSTEGFRDDVLSFGARLLAAGVPTDVHVWSGAFHGFDVVAPSSALARSAAHRRARWIESTLAYEV